MSSFQVFSDYIMIQFVWYIFFFIMKTFMSRLSLDLVINEWGQENFVTTFSQIVIKEFLLRLYAVLLTQPHNWNVHGFLPSDYMILFYMTVAILPFAYAKI